MRTKLYVSWINMKSRCFNKKRKDYFYYGERGITVCEEWLGRSVGFQSFKTWALKNGYNEDLTLERKDNDCNYCPENCYWATQAEQRRNNRQILSITINDKTQCFKDWCTEFGLEYSTAYMRYKRGASLFEALGTTQAEAKQALAEMKGGAK